VDDGKIFKVDTVPPPEGESDPYSAPTRIGTINAGDWAALMDASESRPPSGAGSQRARGEPMPASERAARAERVERETPSRANEIPPPPALPDIAAPSLHAVDGAEDLRSDRLGVDASEAAAETPRVSAPLSLPPSRPSAFPEWVAGTNVLEKAARDEARRRKVRARVVAAAVMALVLVGLGAALMRR